MKCNQCGNEFESKRATAKFCSPKCRKLAFLSVPEKVSVPTPERVSVPKVSVPDEKKLSVPKDPFKRITKAQTVTFFDGGYFYDGKKYQGDYYKSDFYENLKEELSVKPLEQLKEEGYYIPTWKLNGQKYPEGSRI